MKELSTEIIEIEGKEYTLFLNRKGLVAWEKSAKLRKIASDLQATFNKEVDEDIKFDGNANPFELYADADIEKAEQEEKEMREAFAKFYWIALYEKHQFNYDDARVLFDKAIEEYGLEQLIMLANQMIKDVNTNKAEKEVKNLKALRQVEENNN